VDPAEEELGDECTCMMGSLVTSKIKMMGELTSKRSRAIKP